jgi:hypothetical protein
MPIVDAHIHIFPPEVIAERAHFSSLDPHFGELYVNPRCRLATANGGTMGTTPIYPVGGPHTSEATQCLAPAASAG